MDLHSLDRRDPVRGSSDRAFGLVFSVVFALIGLYPWLHGAPARRWSLVAAVALLAIALFRAAWLAPLNRLWTRFGLLLHRIVSPIVLGFMFFVVVTPTGVLMRTLGKDPLRRQWDRAAASYWIERTPPGPSPESLTNQF